MTNYRQISEERNHVEMAKHPELWPMWPYLPLKHSVKRDNSGFPELGLLLDSDPPKAKVFHNCLYLPITSETPVTEYASFEELFADGWVVD